MGRLEIDKIEGRRDRTTEVVCRIRGRNSSMPELNALTNEELN